MERNINLDYFKLFLAILVITIHIPTENTPYKALYLIFHEGFSCGLARIAVPCFFIINGYFLKIDDAKKTRKYILHIIILYTTWSLFYLPWFPDEMNLKRAFTVIFFGFHHLWYLAALLESVIFYYFINKIIKNKQLLLILSILLFVAGYLIHLLLYAPPTNLELNRFRNFLFVGLPFLILGSIIKSINIEKYKKSINIALIMAFILFVIEVYISKALNITEVYLSLFLLCPLSLMAVLNYPKYSNNTTSIGLLSSAIYFVHPFIISISRGLFGYHLYIFPIVTILSILFSFLIIYSNKTIKIFL